MNESFSTNERIVTSYSHYNARHAEDSTFVELFNSLSSWLKVVDQKRGLINAHVISSNKAQVLVIPNDEKTSFSLIWDVSFWDFYEQFVRAFFSIMSIASDENLPGTIKAVFFSFTENFFSNCIIDYLAKRFSSYKNICCIFEKYKVDCKNALLYINDNLRESCSEVCTLGKEFVLMHELEHILYTFSHEIYKKDSVAFDEALKWFHDVMIPLFDSEIIQADPEILKQSVEYIQNNKDGKDYLELFNDYHAFFEVMLHHQENIFDTRAPFTRNSQSYLFGIKLLKMFESCINYLTRVVESAVSTRFQTPEQRFTKVIKTSEEYQRIVFSRDYLSVEIMWVGLFWFADRFPINKEGYIKSLDTLEFAQPYTKVLEPLVNSLANELINAIIRST